MNESITRSFVSQAAVPMAWLEADGAIGVTSPSWDALVTKADHEAVHAALREVRLGKAAVVDVQLHAAEGRWMRLQATAVAGTDAVLAFGSDLTPLRTEMADLRDRVEFMEWQALSLSTFAKVMASARLVLFSMSSAGVVTMCDGKGLELVGQKPGEAIGRDELAATVGTPRHEHLLRALRGETLRVLEEPVKGVFFDTWYLPQRDEHDRSVGVLGLSIDATERVVSEQRLVEKTALVAKQTATIRDLAAPIIKVWEEIVCMPIIGSVDAPRASDMMERLLESIVREQARFAILDLTGVEVMDTPTVHHMLQIFAAARAVGVEGVVSGVSPAVAQSVVTLGIDIRGVRMMRTLHSALAWCLEKREVDARKRGRLSSVA